MDGNPRTVEEIFQDFRGRRDGLLGALTIDRYLLCYICDPELENMCLYGYPTGRWQVSFPPTGLPPAIPQPVLGINFANDGMPLMYWLVFVATHSDSWLISLASFFAARAHLTRNDRARLFDLINELPTLLETVSGRI